MRIGKVVFLLLFFLLASNSFSQQTHVRFDHIGVEQGLSDNIIIDALQDNKGDIWLATANGLNRYDGRTCKVFKSSGSDLFSLDHVNNIIIDHKGTLWLSTFFKGLYFYNAQSETFTHLIFPDTNPTIYNYKNSIRQVIETSNHEMWALSVYGIARYMPEKNIWKWYTQSLDSFVFTRNNGNWMEETKDSVLFAGFFNTGDLFYFDKSHDGFRKFTGKKKNHKPLTKSIISILDDSFGNLWYGSDEGGLVCYNYRNDTWKKYRASQSSDSLQSNEIGGLFEDSEKNLWIGTVNGGLSRFDRKRNIFVTYQHNDLDAGSLSSKTANVRFEDKDHNLIITTPNGLNVLNRRKNQFAFYGKSLIGNKIVSQTQSSAFYESPDGTVWVGTDGQGLQAFNPQSGIYKTYNTGTGFPTNVVLKIEPNGDGQLWLATWSGGLILFNPKTGSSKIYTAQNSGLSCNNIKGLCKVGNFLWIGTHGKGLNIYDCTKNVFYNIENQTSMFNFNMGLPIWINDVFKDSYNDVWISSTFGLFHVQKGRKDQYILFKNNESNLSGFNIRKVFEDSKKNLWICSNGLDLYDRKTNRFTQINNRNNDLPTIVNAMEEDRKGRLWLSGNDGLYCYDYSKNRVDKYTELDGIQGNRFIERASLKTRSGLLYFGGYSGFNVFDPSKLDAASIMPKVIIRSCKNLLYSTDNTKLPIQMEFIHQNPIAIPYGQSHILTFEYVAPTLQTPENIVYTARLQGFDVEERQLGKQLTVTYTNLAPGKYTLYIKAYNQQHKNLIQIAEVHFTILRPWYMTWIFRIFLTLVLLGLISLYFYFRTRLLANRNILLSNLVKKRTEQLEEQNMIINTKNKNLNEIIETRDKLLAILSHDLKNPISVLHGYTNILESQYGTLPEDERKLILHKINKSSESVKLQVLNLLDWALSQSGKMQCLPEDCNCKSVVRDEIMFLLPSAELKNIKIHESIELDQSVWVDIRMLGTVIRNIISNSIKFCNKGGEITISVTKKETQACIQIHDNGIGIDADKIDRIIDSKDFVSTFGTENEKGTGLGLIVCKEFVEKNNGSITIQSVVNEGTTLTIYLPLGTTYFEESMHHQDAFKEIVEKDEELKQLLIVEDNLDMMQLLKQSLSAYFDIECASNGQIGYEIAKRSIPDIVLSDIDMPVLNGIEFCRKMKAEALTNHIPIIFISANDSVIMQIEGFRMGVDDYIVKPFNIDILKAKITALLQNRENLSQHIKNRINSEEAADKSVTDDDVFLERTITLIDNNIRLPELSIEFLAMELGFSRQQFYRKLKAIVGQSPIEFLTSYKLKKARVLLKSNRYRISEVAYQLGFNEPKYFSLCFTKEFGQTPSQFIKENQE
jgi:signal transduction histidine kinase/DNA-binding response OmpR family regulator/streptogramin lyase